MPIPFPILADYERLETRLNFVYRRTFAGQSWDGVRLPSFSCWLVEAGEAELHGAGFSKLTVPAEYWVVIFPLTLRDQILPQGTRLLSVNFTLNWRAGGPPLFKPRPPLLMPAAKHKSLERTANQLLKSHDTLFPPGGGNPEKRIAPADYLRLNARLYEWLTEWFGALAGHSVEPVPPGSPPDLRVQAVIEHLRHLPYCQHLPYQDFARLSGLSRPQLDRLFREQIGRSPKDCADQFLLERARRLLEDEGRSSKETAAALGFTHASYFSTWFKRLTGTEPRRQHLL